MGLYAIRPSKVDSLFPISHFLDFEAGGRSLFIIDYAEVIQPGNVNMCFTTENYKMNKAPTITMAYLTRKTLDYPFCIKLKTI